MIRCLFKHEGGIHSLRVKSIGEVVWELNDTSHESNELWQDAQVPVTGPLTIQACRGDTDNGYVAVDTVILVEEISACEIIPAEATPTPTPTPTPPVILPSCQFETDTCGWQAYGLAFLWEITNTTVLDVEDKPRPLGPTSGNYLYASGLDGFSGESTELESPAFEQPACLSFKFSMFVSNLTKLYVR